MPYAAEISRANPTCFLFLVDQSKSMENPIGGRAGSERKCDVVAGALNRLLQELSLRCAREEDVREYFHVGDLVSIKEVANAPANLEERVRREPDGAGGMLERTVKVPTWVRPVARGETPMCGVLKRAHDLLGGWLGEHPECFPPVVLNLTDGESSDGHPLKPAETLCGTQVRDGSVLLFNLHVSSDTGNAIAFPDSDKNLPNEHARLLFSMSSVLPEGMRRAAEQQGITATDGTRGFVFNADVVSLVQFLEIGTRVNDPR
jgi:hypothetical protein